MLKTAIILALCCLQAPAYRDRDSASTNDNWQLKLEVDTPLSSGAAHQIGKIVLTNTSDATLWVVDSNAIHDFQIDVLDVNGQVVGMTSPGQQLRDAQNRIFTHVRKATIKSQGSLIRDIDLRQFYDLIPGNYTIRVKLRSLTGSDLATVPKVDNAAIKPSATLPISVVP